MTIIVVNKNAVFFSKSLKKQTYHFHKQLNIQNRLA